MDKVPVSRAILAGFFATVIVTVIMYAAPLIGMPKMDIAALLGSFLSGQMPEPMTGVWWHGMILHFINGTILLPLVYAVILYNLLPGTPWLKGLSWGMILWFLSQVLAMPILGMGFFSANTSQPALAVIRSLLSHIVYGSTLGLIAGVQVASVPNWSGGKRL